MENRNEILSKLYSLRAGLSSISVEKDKYTQTQKKLNELESSAEKKLNDLNEEKQKKENNLRQCKGYVKYRKTIADVLVPILLCLGGIVSGALTLWFGKNVVEGILFFINIPFNFMEFEKIPIGYYVLCIPLVGWLIFPALTIAAGIGCFVCFSQMGERITYTNSKIYLKSEASRLIEEAQDELNEVECQISTFVSKTNNKKELHQAQLVRSSKASNGLYDVMVQEYTPLIDIRDWKYLDLLIFYFETGRADNMKEALQQVDRERQTADITNAVHAASAQIENTIRRGFFELQSTIEERFAEISGQLNEQNKQLSNLNKNMSLGNALQAKSNATSEKLLKDAKYMRTVAEVKNRNITYGG